MALYISKKEGELRAREMSKGLRKAVTCTWKETCKYRNECKHLKRLKEEISSDEVVDWLLKNCPETKLSKAQLEFAEEVGMDREKFDLWLLTQLSVLHDFRLIIEPSGIIRAERKEE